MTTQPFVRDRLTWLLYMLAAQASFYLAALGPLMPFVREEMHISYTIASLHFSAWAAGSLIAGTCGDKVMRALGRANTIWLFGTIATIGAIILLCGRTPYVTVFGALIAGTCNSIMGQTMTAIHSDRFGPQRAVAITEMNIAASVIGALAPIVGSLCVRFGLGWRTALLLPVFAFVLLLTNCRSVLPPGSKSKEKLARVEPDDKLPPAYWAYWVTIIFSVAAEWSLVFWSAEFLEHAAKMAKADASAGVTAFLVAMLGGRLIGSRLTRTMNLSVMLPIASLVAIAGFLMFWLSPVAWMNVTGLFFAGLGIANFYPLTLSAAIGTTRATAKATSRMSLGTGTAVLAAPFVLGMVADQRGIFVAYGMVAAFLTLAAAMIVIATLLAQRAEMQTDEPVAQPHGQPQPSLE